ncbi:hypothetical protein LPJ59_000885 [Coemansia sp. RSA 2399]|nr:hypothetical protein LPJ59_000885 [Coemansia sp. RSA 2399]KAJ1907448.1 hypothetical protein LPJ81_000748 [Coemansia sp. IMI 209127]
MVTENSDQIIKRILEKFPGVGDDEFTHEEREYVLEIARNKNPQPSQEYLSRMQYGILVDAKVPASIGRIRNYEYAMPQDQQPYKISDATVERKLNRLYEQDKSNSLEDGHGMVVASSASLGLNPHMELQDAPICENERIVLFLCGGGFIISDAPIGKWYYLRMSKEMGQRLFVPKYSVAPKHVFPRAVHDVYTACTHLLAQGFKPGNITLCANSAGGSIAAATLLLLNECKMPMLSRCILVAPILDLTMSQDSWIRNKDNCTLSQTPLLTDPKCISRLYYGHTDNAEPESLYETFRHPLLSPLFSSDLSCLPPLQIHVGDHDVLLDDSRLFAQKVNQAHRDCRSDEKMHAELITYPEKNHFSIMRGKTQLDKVYGSIRRFLDTP